MAQLTTEKVVNLGQLSVEMGRIGLRAVGPDEDGQTNISTDGASEDELEAAIAAHVADPNWTDPNPPPEVVEAEKRDAERSQAQADIDTIAEKVRAGTFDFQKDGIDALKAVLLKESR